MRTLTLLVACLLVVLTGCGSSTTSTSDFSNHDKATSSSSTPPSQTQDVTWPHVSSLEITGKILGYYAVEVDPPVKIKVVASGADEVELVMTDNGQLTPTVITTIPNPNPNQKGDEQTYEYEWTPPADYGPYVWAIAKSGTDQSESIQYHLKINKKP